MNFSRQHFDIFPINRSQVRLWLSTLFQNVMSPVWTQSTCLLALLKEDLVSVFFKANASMSFAFWKRLIGIFKMIDLVSWGFKMNIKSNICRIYPGIEAFQKDFS